VSDAFVEGERFITAWINLDKFPGSMMMSSGPQGTKRYGPVPGTTGCLITTSEQTAEEWRARGQLVTEIQLLDEPRR